MEINFSVLSKHKAKLTMHSNRIMNNAYFQCKLGRNVAIAIMKQLYYQ